jgi:hypothetical protein
MRLQRLFAPGKKQMIITADGSSYDLNLADGETMYARLSTKNVREPFVFILKPMDEIKGSDIRVYFSTKYTNPNE